MWSIIKIIPKIIIFITVLSLLSSLMQRKDKDTQSQVYYFDPTDGNNNNSGKSKREPFKSLDKIQVLDLMPGDKILLAAGETFRSPLILKNIIGQHNKPITISSFKKGKDTIAHINITKALNGILIENGSFIEINNISVSTSPSNNKESDVAGNMRCGVLVHINREGSYEHIYLKNLTIKNIFYENPGFKRPKEEIKTANGTQNYGWGIRFINNQKNAILSDILVDSVIIKNVAHTGLKLTASKNGYGIQDFKITNNEISETGGPGVQMSGVKNGYIANNFINKSGNHNDSRKWGRGSGLWTWGSRDILIENNRLTNANGPGDSAGAHIDYNCRNVVLQYNFSANNAGGFCEVLGNNHNCSYRYNISVNDGHRIIGENGAFQEGKIFWLSGYVGQNKERTGPFNTYFYNNTIYVKKDIQAKMAIDNRTEGVLIANNIFHIEGKASLVKGDQYKPENKDQWLGKNIVFENNLFLHDSSWPKEFPLKDSIPFFGNAKFADEGGFIISDYTPNNAKLVKDKGIEIKRIPKDSIGLIYGLHLKQDILGNKINGLPDYGAIEMQ